MSHHHHKHQECDCPCHEHEHSCCQDDSCSIAHHDHHDHGSFSTQLFELADEAWMELLREKIKKQIEASSGPHLDNLAKIVSDANHARWQSKTVGYRNNEDFHEKLRGFFHK
jgi:hypothetical protein